MVYIKTVLPSLSKTCNTVLVPYANFKLTVNMDRDRVLHEVDNWHHHAGEGLLIFERCLSDKQAWVGINADALGITICGLNRCLALAGLFDQQITNSAIFFFLKFEKTLKTDRMDRSIRPLVHLYITVLHPQSQLRLTWHHKKQMFTSSIKQNLTFSTWKDTGTTCCIHYYLKAT